MKISFNWITSIIDYKIDFNDCIETLTDIGLEVEKTYDYCSFSTDLSQLLVGNVKKCIKHPNADRLKLTTIDIGEENSLQIVCGAPNVDNGQTVIVAPIGASLTVNGGTSFKIKKAKIRGVESNGMLCAENEIGIGKNSDGIIVLKKKG